MHCPAHATDNRRALESIFTAVHTCLVNKLIQLEMFVTLCYARFDIGRHKMWYLDCGHTKTIHYRHSTGKPQFLYGANLPLGVEEQAAYRPVVHPEALVMLGFLAR